MFWLIGLIITICIWSYCQDAAKREAQKNSFWNTKEGQAVWDEHMKEVERERRLQ